MISLATQPKFDLKVLKESFASIREIKKDRDQKIEELDELRVLELKVRKSLISLKQNLLIARANKDPKKIEVAQAKFDDAEATLAGLQEMKDGLSVPVREMQDTLRTNSLEVIKNVPPVDHRKVCDVSIRILNSLHELMELHKQVRETKDLYHMATGDSLDLTLFYGGDPYETKRYTESLLENISKILSHNFYGAYLSPEETALVAAYKEQY